MSQPNITTYIVDSFDGFLDLASHAEDINSEFLSLDLETDSVNEKTAKIFGVGMCFRDNEAFYIPIRNKAKELLWGEEQLAEIYGWVSIQCKRKKLIGWNLIYDVLVVENNSGLNISQDIYSDGILLKHTIDEERPFGLKENAVKYLGPWADKAQQALYASIQANGGSTTKDNLEMWKADTDVLAEYCAWDTVLALKMFHLLDAKLREEGLEKLFYEDEIMPLYREVTVDMKRKGFHVNVPYFNELRDGISKDIAKLEDSIQEAIKDHVRPFCDELLTTKYPAKKAGSFPKVLAALYNVPVPTKDGKVSLAKSSLAAFAGSVDPVHSWYYDWLLHDAQVAPMTLRTAQIEWLKQSEERRHVFNLNSTDHLGWLFFTHFGEEPLSKTETGKPQCDDDFLESVKDRYDFVSLLVDYKKLIKLSSTYIDGILARQQDGIVYTSMLQFGTTSGRYSSANPNLQNIPRVKDEESSLSPLVLFYTNAIKRGFVAPKGYKIVNADYSSLEPVCFAHVSNEERLRDVFRKGYDLYSAIAIDVFGLTDCSADKKAPNYLKKKYPEKRQLAKIFCLAVVYGAEAGRISSIMGVEYQEAEEIIQAYLDAYPELKSYMFRCDYLAKTKGQAVTQFGRVRHLPKAKDLYSRWGEKILDRRYAKKNGLGDIRYTLKNALNNSKNFPIQGLASHIVNRAMIAISREFKSQGIDGYIAMTVHDEICCVVRNEHVERAKKIVQHCMENTTKISVPLSAEPFVGDNWSDAKQ